MIKARIGLWIVLVVIFNGCATISTTSDWDKSAEFGSLKTYAWVPGPQERTGSPRLDNTLLNNRIRNAVDSALHDKSYVKKSAESADFWVQYHASIEEKLDVTQIDMPYSMPHYTVRGGYDFAGRSSFGETQKLIMQYEEGTVLIDVVDPKNRKLLWRGSGSATIDPRATPEKRKVRIQNGVRKILEKFPPTP